jgi:hypothetical protein
MVLPRTIRFAAGMMSQRRPFLGVGELDRGLPEKTALCAELEEVEGPKALLGE